MVASKPSSDKAVQGRVTPVRATLPAMGSRTIAEPPDEWIALPLQQFTKNELKQLGVPGDLVSPVRAASTVAELRSLELDPALAARLEVMLLQQVASLPHRAFNRDHLSDLRQDLVEILLALDPRQQETVDRVVAGGTHRIRGVAGSGKTQVLLHALAKRLYQLPHAADLMWSYNRPLMDMAGTLLRRLAGARARRVTLDTFDRWCMRQWGGSGRILSEGSPEAQPLVLEARDQARKATWDPESKIWGRDADFWRQEFDFIRDQPIEALVDYLEVERVGRGTRLDRAHRPLVWIAYEKYTRILSARNLSDWRQVRLEAYRKLLATRCSRYEHVFIDEAQDLPPLALKIAQLLAGPNITVAMDGSQAIYRKGFRWKDLGLGQARHTTLTTCYRTTSQIARAAERFRAPEDEPLTCSTVREGPKPKAVDVLASVYEADWVIQDIARRLAAREITPSHVAILTFQRSLAMSVTGRLRARGFQVSCSTDGALDLADGTIKVLTMSSAKGLEFPIVYIAPLWDQDFFPRERGQEAEEHRLETEQRLKVLYVAMTRARQELILVHRKGRAARVLAELNQDGVEHVQGVLDRGQA